MRKSRILCDIISIAKDFFLSRNILFGFLNGFCRYSGGVYTTQFLTKTENLLCVLPIHLHDNGVLTARKCKLLQSGFKVQVFASDSVIISM